MKLSVSVVIFTLSIFFCASAIFADTLKDEASIKKFTIEFMEKIGSSDTATAFEILRPYSNLNDADYISWSNQSMQTRQEFSMKYGPSEGYVFLKDKKIGDIIYMLQYVEKTRKQALIWIFYFYKTKDGWMLDELGWTDQLSAVFQ